MLDFLRRKAQSTSIQVTILIIILVFVFWGVGTNQNGGRDSVASVDGQSISYQQYRRTYEQTVNRYREQLGGSIPAGLLEQIGVKQQVLNQLIQQLLLQEGARETGLLASNEEVQKAILEMGSFQENGIFSSDRYTQILASSKITKSDFESSIRNDIMDSKIVNHVSRFARVAESELADRFAFENDQVKLEYAAFSANDFAGKVTVDDEALNGFYEKNGDNYKTEPQVKLKYILFRHDQAADSSVFSDQEIAQYYQDNVAQYSTPEQRHARHILIKVAENDSPELKATKQKKAETILALAKAGKDFAELAREYSEGPSGPGGGDLGFFGRGQMVPPFDEAVFALKEGELSDVVETQFGFHIIKLEKINPASVTPQADVRKEIIAALAKRQGKSVTFALANKAYEDIILAGSIEKYAAQGGSPLAETDFFSRTAPPAALAGEQSLINTAFSLKKGELSSLLEGSAGYAILYVEDRKEPVVPPLAEVRAQVEKDFIADGATGLAREAAEALLAAAGKAASFAEAAQQAGSEVRLTEFYSRDQRSTSNLPASVAGQGLDLSGSSPYPAQVAAAGDVFYVLHFKESKPADPQLFAAQRSDLKNRLTQEKQMKVLAGWLDYLHARAKVTVNQTYLQN